MSDWTYIQGSLSLETSPYKIKKGKDGCYRVDKKAHDLRFYESRYLPFGKEQMKVSYPELRQPFNSLDGKKVKAKMSYKVELTSYPIIKEYVDKYIQDMPQGELGLFYSLVKASGCRSSSSCCESKQVEDLYYEHLKEVYKDEIWDDITRKELDKYFPNDVSWFNHQTESILTIHDSVRYCVASEMYKSLIAFLNNLAKNEVDLGDGVFAFNDYFDHYTMIIDNDKITVQIKEDDKEPRVEYWQVFCKSHFIRESEYELRKVDDFKRFNDYFDDSESQKEVAEYRAKYEPEEDSEEE